VALLLTTALTIGTPLSFAETSQQESEDSNYPSGKTVRNNVDAVYMINYLLKTLVDVSFGESALHRFHGFHLTGSSLAPTGTQKAINPIISVDENVSLSIILLIKEMLTSVLV